MSDSLAAALTELQANVPRIAKRAKGQHGKYADLPAVAKVLYPALRTWGLFWQTWPTWEEGPGFVLAWKLTHLESGEYLSGWYPIHATDPQRAGSEITYARRYALVTVTGVTPEGDDDDGGQAASRARTPAKIPGPDHERLRNGTMEPTPDDKPTQRIEPGDNPPGDMWMDNAKGELQEFRPEDRPGTIDARQLKDMGIKFSKLGIRDAGVRHGIISQILEGTRVGPVTTAKQLSRLEAERVIKQLDREIAEQETGA